MLEFDSMNLLFGAAMRRVESEDFGLFAWSRALGRSGVAPRAKIILRRVSAPLQGEGRQDQGGGGL